MDSIAQKLSWEIVAMNDAGEASARTRMALEIAYGVSLKVEEPALFSAVMEQVAEQVSDKEVQRLLRMWIRRVR